MAYITKKTTVDGVKPIGSNLYGSCDTASGTADKVVSMPDFNVLVPGVTIHVGFSNKNTASSPRLKVGSTSAVAIKRNGSLEGVWEDGSVISFTYDGTNWVQNDADISGKTYGLSYNDSTNVLSIVEGGGSQSVTITDDDTTYSLSISGHTITLTPSSGTAQTITLPDDDTTYTLSISGHTVTMTGSDGLTSSVTIPDANTTYSLSKSGSTITLTGSDGSTTSVTDSNTTYNGMTQAQGEAGTSTTNMVISPKVLHGVIEALDDDTTYTLSKSGSTVTLTGSDGSTSSVTDADTKYGLQLQNGKLKLVEGGNVSEITLPDDDTTYTLHRNLETITHMLYVNLDGRGYFYDEDNFVTNNDGYEYTGTTNTHQIYIVDDNGNDITGISSYNLQWNGTMADAYTFGQNLYDYFLTHNAYRLKIDGVLTQKITRYGTYYGLTEAIPDYDRVTAKVWDHDGTGGDRFYVVAQGVVLGNKSTIDLVGSDGTTSSVSLKAIDIGALPTAQYHANDATHDGYVTAPGTRGANKVWKTDANGEPGWRNESGGASYPSMTQAQGEAGTSTTDSVVSPKVLHDVVEALDDDTTYSLSKLGDTITLTGSDGSTSSVTDSDTTYSDFVGASGSSAGVHGLVPAPASGDNGDLLYGDAKWRSVHFTDSSGLIGVASVSRDNSHAIVKMQNATTASAGLMSASDKGKLDGIESGAEVNVQSDWNQTDSTADDYIKNKPTIPSAVQPTTTTPLMDGTANVGSETLYARGDHVHPSDTSKQDTLVSGTNIKTINNQSLLGSGNITISGGGGGGDVTDVQIDGTSVVSNTVANILPSDLIDIFYPIGSYYETSDTSFDPNASWGGTWIKDSAGRVTVAQDTSQTEFDTVDETGGAKTYTVPTTKLSDAQMAHGHGFTNPKIPNHVHSNTHTHSDTFKIKSASPNNTGSYTTNYVQFGKPTGTTYENDNPLTGSVSQYTGNTGNPTSLLATTGGAVTDLSGASSTRTAHGHGSVSTLQPYIVVNRWHRTA